MKTHVACLLLLVAISIPFFANAQVPFGGLVTAVQPCNQGLLVYLKTATGPMAYMWHWGQLPYLSYIPPHPGQYLLGVAIPITEVCMLGYIPSGVGFPIKFHGSSL